jgi:hypothetical protein
MSDDVIFRLTWFPNARANAASLPMSRRTDREANRALPSGGPSVLMYRIYVFSSQTAGGMQ